MQRSSQTSIVPVVAAAVALIVVAVLVIMTLPFSIPAVILGALAAGIALAISGRQPRDRALAFGLIGAAVGLMVAAWYVYSHLLAV